MEPRSLFAPIPGDITGEVVETLLETPAFRIERIVSRGHVTPPGQWLEQDAAEWVVLLSGSARLVLEGHPAPAALEPGMYVLIPAGRRHRVEATDPHGPSVWLAIHFPP